jgi:pimeloyl-ACP methyl ester carboxylesterase
VSTGSPRPFRRRVVYVSGYDPSPPGDRRDLLARELDRAAANGGWRAEVGPLVEKGVEDLSSWRVRAAGPDWSCETDYLMPRWDDLVRRDFEGSMPRRWARLVWMTLRTVLDGTFWRMVRQSHFFVLFWLYPVVTTLLVAVGAVLWARELAGLLAPQIGIRPAMLLGIGFVALVAVLYAWMCRATYLKHLMELWLFARDYAEGRRPDVQARARLIGDHLAALAARTDVDETIVVGHSYGTVVGTEALAHAIATRPEAFRAGAPVAFLTLGSLHGAVTSVPGADAAQSRIEALAATDAILWVELLSRQDILNFYRTAPWAFRRAAPDPAWPNPTVYRFLLRDALDPVTYRRFRKNYFRMHFQWIMANDKPFRYDYPLIVAGPVGFAARFGLEWPREVASGTPRRTGGVAQRSLHDA